MNLRSVKSPTARIWAKRPEGTGQDSDREKRGLLAHYFEG